MKIRKIISIVAIIVIVICLGKILYKQYEYHEGVVTNKKVQKIMGINPIKNEDGFDLSLFNNKEYVDGLLNKQTELLKINPNYKFWMTIPGTEVDYPVVQTDNNSFYLHHDFYNKKSIEGTLFVNDKTNIDTSKNTIVFGHNMRNATMFGSLWPFKDTNFFDTHKYIEIIRNGHAYVYEIFGDAVVHADYNYIISDFKNENDFMNYIDGIKSKAMFWRNIELNSKSKILTLSTCSYEFPNARFIILAKLVKEV